MTTFERIKQLAKKRGYTLSALNDKAGLGTNSIYHWRNKTPSTQSLNKVAKVLGVSADYLQAPQEATAASESNSKTNDDETTKDTEKAAKEPEKLKWWQRIFK